MEQNLKSLAAENRLALWTQRVSDCRSSGKSVKVWCEENNLSHKTYYYWQHKLFCMAKAECAPQFVEMPAAPKSKATALIASVHIGAAQVNVYAGADEATLGVLFRALQQC